MAEYTTHYNLKKPAKNENYNIDVANENNDIIDEKLYGKVDKKVGKDLSTNDFTDEYRKKLSELSNYDDSKIKKEISAIKEENKKQEETIEEEKKKMQEYNDNAQLLKEKVELLESNLEDVKASGENVEIDDALKYYTDNHKIYGKSEQETRELSQDTASGEEVSLINVETSKDIDIFVDGNSEQGENSSPENEQPIEVIDGCNRFDVQEFQNQFVAGKILNDDGNEISDSTSQYSKYKIFLKANKSYYIKGAFQRLYYYDSAGNFKKRSQSVDGIDRAYMPVKDEYISFQINNNFWNTNKGSEQLTEGTEKKPYLPHGSIGLKLSGKNKFNVNGNIQQLSSSNYYTRVENNKVIIPYSNGYEQSALFESINVKGGKTYTISCKLEQGIARLAFRLYDINNSLISSTIEGVTYLDYYKGYYRTNVTKVTVTLPIEAKYLRILTINSTTTNNEETILSEIQLEEGEGTTYEPYHEPKIVEIALNGNSIAKINDSIKDELSIYRNGKVILGKKTNRYIFTGNEEWKMSSLGAGKFYVSDLIDYKLKNENIGSAPKSNYFLGNESSQFENNKIQLYRSNNVKFIRVENDKITTLEDWKQWLKEQYENGTPVYLDYELATPQTIELPSVDMPELWEGTVNVDLISNLSTNLNVNYNIVPAMPSLEVRSDIESTGEKYNIFNKDARIIISGTTKENLDTGVRVIGTIDGQYRYCSIELGKKELLGKNITMQAKIQSSNQNVGLISINFGNENSPAIKIINSFNKEYEKKVFSIPTEFPENCDRIYLILYANLNGTLKKGDYVDYKDLMVSIGSNEKPYVPYDIGAINIKQQNENLLNTFDYTYVSGDKNITFKNGQFIFNGTWEKWLAQLYTWSLTNYWVETNYGDYMDLSNLSKKSVNILKAGKYYLKIKYISGNISTNGGLKFTYRLDTNTTGKSLNIGEFKSNVKKGDIIKKTFEITEDTPFTLMTTMIRTEDTSYDNFTFEVMLEKDEETENFEEHKEVNHQMILSKKLKGIKTNDSTKANYIDENGNYWITDYVADDGIHRKIGEISFDGTENDWSNQESQFDTDTRKLFALQITSIKNDTKNRQAICNLFKYTNLNIQSKITDITAFHFNNGADFSDFIYFKIEKFLLPTPDLAGWKKLLVQLKENNTPLTVQYELGEEKLEEFTEEERKSWNEFKKLKTFKGKNYINSTDEIQAGIEFTYKKDSRISTKKELEKCNERLNNIENLLNTTETSALLLDNLENDLKKEVE